VAYQLRQPGYSGRFTAPQGVNGKSFFMHRWLIAALAVLCACGAGQALAEDDFRAGLTLRAGFGGAPEQEWRPHVLASFGSGPTFLAQGRSSEAQCLMTAGDLRINRAVSASSACEDAPLLQFDLHSGGLGSANLLGLNLMKAPSLFNARSRDLLSGNSEWVDWTLKRHAAFDPGASTLGLDLLPPLRVR
jgi:hypothetical protein